MNIVDKSIVLNMDVTVEIWSNLKKLVSNHTDIALVVKNANIYLEKFDIPEEISSVSIVNCVFESRTKLSGLKDGRLLEIKNCSKKHIMCSLIIEHVDCMVFNYHEDKPKYKSILYEKYISVRIENSVFEHCHFTSVDAPIFHKVAFIKKLQHFSHARHDNEVFFFEECIFYDFLNIIINNVNRLDVQMTKCKVGSTRNDWTPTPSFTVDDVVIRKLNIIDSDLSNMYFYLFRKEIEKIEINGSQVKLLQLYTVDDEGEPNRIYDISILDSHIDQLLLNHRHIVHSLLFNRSTFYHPPEMFGANMPHGSCFPDKDGFISRSGDLDASCYRVLRYFMELERNRELEGVFFTLEQESILNKKHGYRKYLSLNYMYYAFSNYGTNYIRPLIILALSIIVFTLIYSISLSPEISPNLPIDWELIKNSFIFTLKQTLQPFSSLKSMTPLFDENTPLEAKFIFIGIINSILSITCLALSGLAIRWKFKRG